MKKFSSNFNHGINQDISVNKYPPTNYYWAQNFRITSKDGLATGVLSNVEGTVPKLDFGTGHTIVGHCMIRDTLILFVSNDEGGKIYKWEYSSSDYPESPTLIYQSSGLVFSPNFPIRAVGRYETPNVQKIYFTDGNTFFKHLNIVPQTGESYPLSNHRDVDSLDIVSDVTFSSIGLELINGGNLKAGKVQYAYQLYSKRGSESMFSPASDLVHLTEADESQHSSDYYGSEVGAVVNKSVEVSIDNIDSLFTRLRLIALDYTVLYQPPTIRVVGEYNVEGLSSIKVTDSGNSIGELTTEQFRFIQNDFYPKTLDTKDDYLFAANIKDKYFEITDDEFDSRAFRANVNDIIKVQNGSYEFTIPHTNGVFSTLPPVTDELYNEYNNLSRDYSSDGNGISDYYESQRCKYKPGSLGTKLGGKGPNIEYEFVTETVVLDDSTRTNNFAGGYPKLNLGVSPTYTNSANPLTKVGYQRDEIYRFGIIFYDKKGRQSFVKWIGDIRFPNNREMPFITYDSTNRRTMANILGIRFSVNIPEDVAEKVSGYQIVRAERTNSDKTVLSQSLVGSPFNENGGDMYSLATVPLVTDMASRQTNYLRNTQEFPPISGGDAFEHPNELFKFQTKYLEFESPEVVFNKTKLPVADAYVDFLGYQTDVETVAIAGERGFEDGNSGEEGTRDMLVADKTRGFEYRTGTTRFKTDVGSYKLYTPKNRGNIDGNSVLDATRDTLSASEVYNNQAASPIIHSDIRSKFGLRGTHAMLTLENNFPEISSWVDSSKPISFLMGNYKVNRGKSIYGGSTYEARTNTKYYPASGFVDKSVATQFATDPDVYTEPKIQILNNNTGKQLNQTDTIMVTTSGYIDLYLDNYGTKTLTINSIDLSAETGWQVTSTGTPFDIEPGQDSYFRISYMGPAEGTQYTSVTINSNAVNIPQFMFTVGVDYAYNTTYPDSTKEPYADESVGTDVVDTSGLHVFNGDTYISYFAYMRSIYDYERDNGQRIETYVFYPVESTMNLQVRLDKLTKYINWGLYRDNTIVDYKLHESVSTGTLTYGVNYPIDAGDLYRYNSAYSSVDKSKEFYPKPFDFDAEVEHDTRIYASEKKINGEYLDNWTKFKFANYIDVDSNYGPINRILTFKNNVYYFQNSAVGIAAVNERSLIKDNNPGALSLGSGGILTRYENLTEQSGTEFYYGVVASDKGIYFVDNTRKRINILTPGGEQPISIIKGIDSFLDSKSFGTVYTGFDRGYDEIVFAIDNFTIAFNEKVGAFTSSYSYAPAMMFSIKKDFFSVTQLAGENPWLYGDLEGDIVGYSGTDSLDPEWDYIIVGPSGTGDSLHKHNVGDIGSFYGEPAADSIFMTIVNPEGDNVCVFDNLDLRVNSVHNNSEVTDDMFYILEASNSYQEITRNLTFSSVPNPHTGSMRKIGKVWRLPVMATNPSNINYPRMLDTYVKITLRYNNSNGYKFRLQNLTTYYRNSSH